MSACRDCLGIFDENPNSRVPAATGEGRNRRETCVACKQLWVERTTQKHNGPACANKKIAHRGAAFVFRIELDQPVRTRLLERFVANRQRQPNGSCGGLEWNCQRQFHFGVRHARIGVHTCFAKSGLLKETLRLALRLNEYSAESDRARMLGGRAEQLPANPAASMVEQHCNASNLPAPQKAHGPQRLAGFVDGEKMFRIRILSVGLDLFGDTEFESEDPFANLSQSCLVRRPVDVNVVDLHARQSVRRANAAASPT
jgi:hypothetical protein